MLRNSPRNFCAFILWFRKNPAKFPPNFPQKFPARFRNPPAWHRGLLGPSGPEHQKSPERVRKESERVSRGLRPREPQNPERVRPGVRKESKNAASDSFQTLFGLRGALFGTLGLRPRDTVSDSFRALLGLRARRAREPSVPGRGVPNARYQEKFADELLQPRRECRNNREGVPQAYVRARASSATLGSVHVLLRRVFLCIFYIKKGI